MKHKIILGIILAVATVGVAIGCGTKDTSKNNDEAKAYLENKYHLSFEYVEDELEESNVTFKKFKDADENTLKVACTIGDDNVVSFSDNYYSVLYDEEIQKSITEKLGTDCRVFVDTSAYMFTDGSLFVNYNEYLDKCTSFGVTVFTKDSAKELGENEYWLNSGKDLSVRILTVSDKAYGLSDEEIKEVPITEISEQKNFMIQNGQMYDEDVMVEDGHDHNHEEETENE